MQITHQIQRIAAPRNVGNGSRLNVFLNVVLCGALLGASMSSQAQDKLDNARAAYQRERANCLNGHTDESRATCLREASAALEAAKRGQLNDTNTNYQQNATLRCQAFPSSDNREACEQRVNAGKVEGSVGGGGILREYTTHTEVQENNSDQDRNGNTAPDHAP